MNLNLMVLIQKIIYLLNWDGFKSIGSHQISPYVTGNNSSTSYYKNFFDSFEVEHIPKESKNCIGNKNIITNI